MDIMEFHKVSDQFKTNLKRFSYYLKTGLEILDEIEEHLREHRFAVVKNVDKGELSVLVYDKIFIISIELKSNFTTGVIKLYYLEKDNLEKEDLQVVEPTFNFDTSGIVSCQGEGSNMKFTNEIRKNIMLFSINHEKNIKLRKESEPLPTPQ